ncbi:hypothetical protein [Deinococcus planocerae]|uniref:hypothetical protein n=1 Tax=Deinococcus planocerae TaxID=1737569 RepID=UPI003CCBD349
MTVVLVIVVALALLAVLLATRPRRVPKSSPAGKNAELHWERKILSQTLGNRGAMERAVTAKRRNYPRASRADLLEMVHDEYVRDRNRS